MSDLLKLSIDSETGLIVEQESNKREFKQNFDKETIWVYAQTMAAFANRDGGVIFFGIQNNGEVLGLVELPDSANLSDFLEAHFEPEIIFSYERQKINKKQVLSILVEPSKNKPIICKSDKKQQRQTKGEKEVVEKKLLEKGAIYYRYGSTTKRIGQAELRKIIDERVYERVEDDLKKYIQIMSGGVKTIPEIIPEPLTENKPKNKRKNKLDILKKVYKKICEALRPIYMDDCIDIKSQQLLYEASTEAISEGLPENICKYTKELSDIAIAAILKKDDRNTSTFLENIINKGRFTKVHPNDIFSPYFQNEETD